jgi:hypothetical protein
MQPDSALARFWQWFVTNGARLRAQMYSRDRDAQESAFAELRDAAAKVAPELTLELGAAPEGGPQQLVISADSRPERVDAVKDFVAAAPPLAGWEVVAFRPRLPLHDDIEIALENERVSPADIWFHVAPGADGLGLTLYVRDLTRANERLRGLGASLLAEHAVGERDALTLLSSLQVKPLMSDPATAGLRPFAELIGVLDAAKRQKYPPPGALPINPDADWMNLRGTINGAPALLMLHGGLRPLAGHPDYDRRLTVTIPFHAVGDDGMPASEDEYQAVGDLEDRVREVLEQGQGSLLALSLLTRGRRELAFYTSNAAAALGRLAAVQAVTQTHALEAAVEFDTYWGMYRSFCQAGQQPTDEG